MSIVKVVSFPMNHGLGTPGRVCQAEGFWELSSLMLFLHDVISDKDVSQALTERLSKMQMKVEVALLRAEQASRKRLHTERGDITCSVLELLEAWDEEVIVDLFGIIFPLNRTVSEALKLRGVNQLREIADYVIADISEPEIIHRANLLREFSARLGGMSVGVK